MAGQNSAATSTAAEACRTKCIDFKGGVLFSDGVKPWCTVPESIYDSLVMGIRGKGLGESYTAGTGRSHLRTFMASPMAAPVGAERAGPIRDPGARFIGNGSPEGESRIEREQAVK
jgi:hypothetical protein